VISSLVISLAVWISKRNPQIAGFIIALPISTMLVLALGYGEQRDPQRMIALAKSICFAIPLSLIFFVPFFLSEKLNMSFWTTYFFGFILLAGGFFIHKFILL
jgi:hypothetical protein